MGWMIRGSNPGKGEIFQNRPGQPWIPPALLYNGYRSIPRDNAAGCGVNHPPPPKTEVEERIEHMTVSKQNQDGTAVPSCLCLGTVIIKLHETYQCRTYCRKLLMIGREGARNM